MSAFEVGQIVMPAAEGTREQGTVERVTSRSVDVWWHRAGVVKRHKLVEVRALQTSPPK